MVVHALASEPAMAVDEVITQNHFNKSWKMLEICKFVITVLKKSSKNNKRVCSRFQRTHIFKNKYTVKFSIVAE